MSLPLSFVSFTKKRKDWTRPDDLFTSFQIHDSIVLVGSKKTDNILVHLLSSKCIILLFEVFINLFPHKTESITLTGPRENGETNNGLELQLWNQTNLDSSSATCMLYAPGQAT